MVNYISEDYTASTSDASSAAAMSASPFNLSKPAALFFSNIAQAKNLKLGLLNTNNSNTGYQPPAPYNFNFVEPFESWHRGRTHDTLNNGLGGGGGGKIKPTIPVRTQPYTLTKPAAVIVPTSLHSNTTAEPVSAPHYTQHASAMMTTMVHKNNSKTVMDELRAIETVANSVDASHQANATTTGHNAILARLSSISSTFKSIFVRPKNSRHVDLDSFAASTKSAAHHGPTKSHEIAAASSTNTHGSNNNNGYKLKLFSTNNEIDLSNGMDHTSGGSRNSIANNELNVKIERIISRQVMNESLQNSNRLNRHQQQHSNNSNSLSTRPGTGSTAHTPATTVTTHNDNSSSSSTSSSSSSSSVSSNISSLSTTSNLTLFSESTVASTVHHAASRRHHAASEAHQRAVLMTTNGPATVNSPAPATHNNAANSSYQYSGNGQKWLCLVCLSKHLMDVRACNVCGSLQQSNASNKSSTLKSMGNKFNTMANKTMDFLMDNHNYNVSRTVNYTIADTTAANNTLRSLNGNALAQQLKTWLCTYCNYANDSLKIVCMNCRSAKQKSSSAAGENSANDTKFSLKYQTLQAKRNRKEANSTVNQNNSTANRLNNSNEENELNNGDDNTDRPANKKSKTTGQCDQYCSNCKSNIDHNNSQQQPAAAASKTNKNLLNAKSVGVDQLVTPTKPADFDKTLSSSLDESTISRPANQNNTNGVTSNSNNTKSTVVASTPLLTVAATARPAKWTCSTCMVPNEASKAACVCCATARPGAVAKTLAAALDQATDVKKPAENNTMSVKPPLLNTALAKWTCSMCLVQNESSSSQCVCCMTARPSADSSSSTTSKTKFSELVAAAGNTEPVSDAFATRAAASSALLASRPTASNISFGLASTTADKPITFGATNSFLTAAAAPQPTTFSTNSAGGFSFGSASASSSSTSVSSGFKFGTTTTTQSESKPVDQAPVVSFGTTAPSSGGEFTFGAATNSSISTQSTTTSQMSFGFQSTAQISTSSSANANNNNNTSSSTTATNMFSSFGSSTTAAQNNAFAAPSTNAQTAAQPAQAALFSGFGSNGFGNASSNQPQQPTTTTLTAPAFGSVQVKPSFSFGGSSTTLSSSSAASSQATTPVGGSTTNANAAPSLIQQPASSAQSFSFGAPAAPTASSSSTAAALASNSGFSTGNSSSGGFGAATQSSATFGFMGSGSSSGSSSVFGSSAKQPESSSSAKSAPVNPFANANSSSTGSSFLQAANPFANATTTSSNNKEASSDSSQLQNKPAPDTPSLFKFGFKSNKQTTDSPTPSTSASTTTATTQNTPFSGFGSGFATKTEPSTTTAATNNAFSSLSSSSNSTAQKPFVFGAATTTGSSTASSNPFGGQPPSTPSTSSAFSFGNANSSATSAVKPFVFGDAKPEIPKPAFNFGGSSNAFSFGSTATTTSTLSDDMLATPHKADHGASSRPGPGSTANTPSVSTPFVFGGVGGAGGQADSPSLQQILVPGASTPSSARLIKKPTRRLKK
jgi:hypothetical protein